MGALILLAYMILILCVFAIIVGAVAYFFDRVEIPAGSDLDKQMRLFQEHEIITKK